MRIHSQKCSNFKDIQIGNKRKEKKKKKKKKDKKEKRKKRDLPL